MNTMTPAQVARNHTARLVAEATTPVFISTREGAEARERARRIEWADDYAGEEYCHVCRRTTDHRGEHSDEQLLEFYAGRGRMFRR